MYICMCVYICYTTTYTHIYADHYIHIYMCVYIYALNVMHFFQMACDPSYLGGRNEHLAAAGMHKALDSCRWAEVPPW
jgi:hypothetical protein